MRAGFGAASDAEDLAVRFGLGLLDLENIPARARQAEELGFDYVHTGEHFLFHGPTPNTFVVLAAAAASTRHIRLLSGVVLLPLYPAVGVAKMASVLDVVSGGRLDLGVGVGGENPREFAAAGVDVKLRGARTDEALSLISELFNGGKVTFDGRWATTKDARLNPPPVQSSGPPIWIGGRSESAIRRAGRFASTWMPYMITPEKMSDGLARVRDAALNAGRDARSVDAAFYGFVSVDDDGDRARQWARDMVGRAYNQDFSKLERYLIAGTPEQCTRRLQEFADAGAESAQLHLACPPEEHDRVLSRLANEVIPTFKTSA